MDEDNLIDGMCIVDTENDRFEIRIFISLPMSGRSDEDVQADIKRAKEQASEYFNSCFERLELDRYPELVFVDTFAQEPAPSGMVNPNLHYLGHSIKVLGTCSFIWFVKGWNKARGCTIEREISKLYNIPSFYESMYLRLKKHEEEVLKNEQPEVMG